MIEVPYAARYRGSIPSVGANLSAVGQMFVGPDYWWRQQADLIIDFAVGYCGFHHSAVSRVLRVYSPSDGVALALHDEWPSTIFCTSNRDALTALETAFPDHYSPRSQKCNGYG